jgi:hypothetical protein
MTIIEVYTPISLYMKKYYQSFYTSSSKFYTSNSWGSAGNGHEHDTTLIVLYYTNCIGQHIQSCEQVYGICLWAI